MADSLPDMNTLEMTVKFALDTAEVFVPDGLPADEALARTTHLCIGAHQDDLEIMAAHPILECFQSADKWFTGVVISDGRGSPRSGIYAGCNDEDMHLVRCKEQRKAAIVGEYAAQVFLDYPSSVIKDANSQSVNADLELVLQATRPEKVFTHNLADKHDTHVAVALKVISAMRQAASPAELYGCEVWRALDWVVDGDKTCFDLSQHENLQMALLGVFDSQISGGKRYDLATLARQKANATFFEPHGVDEVSAMSFALDMSALVSNPKLSPATFISEYIRRFEQEVADRLSRLA